LYFTVNVDANLMPGKKLSCNPIIPNGYENVGGWVSTTRNTHKTQKQDRRNCIHAIDDG